MYLLIALAVQLPEDGTCIGRLIKNEFFVPFTYETINLQNIVSYILKKYTRLYWKSFMFSFLSIRFGLKCFLKMNIRMKKMNIYGVRSTPLLTLLKMWLKAFIFCSKLLSRYRKYPFRDPWIQDSSPKKPSVSCMCAISLNFRNVIVNLLGIQRAITLWKTDSHLTLFSFKKTFVI